MPIDYETLRIIWWLLIGVLLMGFSIMDGFDLGVAMCLPWIAKTDMERRVVINCIAPTWEGNQVWFILGGGALFAAWPMIYAVSFSGFYFAMLLVLLALILRPVGFKYRSKLTNSTWRSYWDVALFVGGFVPALVFGVAIGNVIQGVPFSFDADLRPVYTGTFFALLNPYALLCGVLSVMMLTMHGAYFLRLKTELILQQRALRVARTASLLTAFLFILGGVWLYWSIDGYTLLSKLSHDAPSNPLYKEVVRQPQAWLGNYLRFPLFQLIPAIGVLFPAFAFLMSKFPRTAFLCSAIAIMGIIGAVGASMFPFILPSSSNPAHSLTLWDSSSSQLTLFIMLISTLIFLPIIVIYTAWVYRVLKGKVTDKTIHDNQHTAY